MHVASEALSLASPDVFAITLESLNKIRHSGSREVPPISFTPLPIDVSIIVSNDRTACCSVINSRPHHLGHMNGGLRVKHQSMQQKIALITVLQSKNHP